MQLRNAGSEPSVTNVSIIGSHLVTNICSGQLTNTPAITIAGGLSEVLARERHVPILRIFQHNRPGSSSQSQSSTGCIMCTNGLPSSTDSVFAPFTQAVSGVSGTRIISPPGFNSQVSAAISRLGMRSDGFGQYAMLPPAISLPLPGFK